MSEPSPSFQLAVGDRVVYPNQGVCRVSSVESKEVAGQKLVFVTMRREEDGAVVMVPQAKLKAIGLRKVASAKEVGTIFDFLKSDSDKATLDWKQRARTNVDRMSQGGLLGLAEVVKGLQVLSELRPLPSKERELYDDARHLLVEEIAASLGTPESNAEDAVDLVLFPPGRERPKRTAEEFRPPGEDEDGLSELGDDVLALGGDLDLPPEEEPAPEEPEAEEETADEDEEEAPRAKPAAKKSSPAKKAKPPARAPKKVDEPKRPRGRPPKPKPAVPPPPKKR